MYKNHKSNYHSHTFLCGHAGGSPIDYVKVAIEKNYLELGISEHAVMPMLPNNNSRLKEEDYLKYFELLNEAKELADKHNLKFYKGFEIEYFDNVDLYDKYLKDLDYLILGQHYIIKNNELKSTFALDSFEDVIIYRDTLLKAIKTDYFKMLCHIDLCFFNIKNPTNEMYEALRPVIKLAKEKDLVLELNANGIRRSKYEDDNTDYANFKYPKVEVFKIISEEGAKVLVSSDAHSIDALDDWAIEEAYRFAEKLNLNLVYKLDL